MGTAAAGFASCRLRIEHRPELLDFVATAEREERFLALAVRQKSLEHALDDGWRVLGLDVAKNLAAERGVGTVTAAHQHVIALDGIAFRRRFHLAGNQPDVADV